MQMYLMVRTSSPSDAGKLTGNAAPEKMKTMQETLENVLEEVKTVNGFWSLNDQDVVRASLMEV